MYILYWRQGGCNEFSNPSLVWFRAYWDWEILFSKACCFCWAQVDEEPSIRANTTVLLGNMAAYLGEATCKRVLLNAFTRALKVRCFLRASPYVLAKEPCLTVCVLTVCVLVCLFVRVYVCMCVTVCVLTKEPYVLTGKRMYLLGTVVLHLCLLLLCCWPLVYRIYPWSVMLQTSSLGVYRQIFWIYFPGRQTNCSWFIAS